MKVLITGKNGFVGKQLTSSLTDVEIVSVGRADLDLTNKSQVNALFESNVFDVVIHTAISGGKRDTIDSPSVVFNNLLMFYNIMFNRHRFGKLIQIGSGAEFDRFNGQDINEYSNLYSSYPTDEYGISKNIVSRICNIEQNCYTLRVFNVFGFGELSTRMMSNNISRYITNQDIVIIKNRLMDFFSIEDFVTVCTAYIHSDNLPKDIDCCYSNKLTLLDIANQINNLDRHKVGINILDQEVGNSYCGNSGPLSQLPIKLNGLTKGLSDLHKSIITNKQS